MARRVDRCWPLPDVPVRGSRLCPISYTARAQAWRAAQTADVQAWHSGHGSGADHAYVNDDSVLFTHVGLYTACAGMMGDSRVAPGECREHRYRPIALGTVRHLARLQPEEHHIHLPVHTAIILRIRSYID